jgi:hypothetical protein
MLVQVTKPHSRGCSTVPVFERRTAGWKSVNIWKVLRPATRPSCSRFYSGVAQTLHWYPKIQLYCKVLVQLSRIRSWKLSPERTALCEEQMKEKTEHSKNTPKTVCVYGLTMNSARFNSRSPVGSASSSHAAAPALQLHSEHSFVCTGAFCIKTPAKHELCECCRTILWHSEATRQSSANTPFCWQVSCKPTELPEPVTASGDSSRWAVTMCALICAEHSLCPLTRKPATKRPSRARHGTARHGSRLRHGRLSEFLQNVWTNPAPSTCAFPIICFSSVIFTVNSIDFCNITEFWSSPALDTAQLFWINTKFRFASRKKKNSLLPRPLVRTPQHFILELERIVQMWCGREAGYCDGPVTDSVIRRSICSTESLRSETTREVVWLSSHVSEWLTDRPANSMKQSFLTS